MSHWHGTSPGFASLSGNLSQDHSSSSDLSTDADAVDTYFECISTCSLDDAECITVCTAVLRDST